VGISFKIKDDLLDYNGNGLTGKKEGNDIKEKKITLPLIYALQKAGAAEKRNIKRLIRRKNKTREDIRTVIDFVRKHKGLEYAEQAMACYRNKALDLLSVYPDSDVKDSIISFVLYTTEREK